MNFSQFKSMPDSVLKDITDKPGTAGKPGSAGKMEPTDDIFNEGNHTENAGSSSQAQGGPTATGSSNTGATSAGKILGDKGAKFAVNLMNFAIPALLYLLITKLGYDTSQDAWKLDKEEKETITPVMQAVLDKIMIDLSNPYWQMALVLGLIYGSKMAANGATMKKKKPELVIPEPSIDVQKFTAAMKKQTFEEMYEDALIELINETKESRHVNKEKAMILLKKNGSLKRLEKKIRDKFELQQ